jgi:uncharacterized protein YegP (UPF0339 family)
MVVFLFRQSRRKVSDMTYHVWRAKDGWRWYLMAANNRKIAESGEAYVHKEGAYWGIGLVKTSGTAPIVED